MATRGVTISLWFGEIVGGLLLDRSRQRRQFGADPQVFRVQRRRRRERREVVVLQAHPEERGQRVVRSRHWVEVCSSGGASAEVGAGDGLRQQPDGPDVPELFR